MKDYRYVLCISEDDDLYFYEDNEKDIKSIQSIFDECIEDGNGCSLYDLAIMQGNTPLYIAGIVDGEFDFSSSATDELYSFLQQFKRDN